MQGFLFTDGDVRADATTDFAERMRRAADADEGRDIIRAQDIDAPDADWIFGDGRGAFNHCTLDGQPARIIGRASPYATIEPVDLDAEPIYCAWDVVADVLDERDGAFVSEDAE